MLCCYQTALNYQIMFRTFYIVYIIKHINIQYLLKIEMNIE